MPKDLIEIKKSVNKIISKNKFKNKYILYKALGFNSLLRKDLDNSIKNFRTSIKYKSADQLGEVYQILFSTQFFLKKDTLEAIAVLNEKIKNDSALHQINSLDYTLLGHVFLAKKDYENAALNYNKSLGVAQNPDAWLGLAFIELKDQKLKEANDLINKAYEINPNYSLTYALFGITTYLNGQKDDAKNSFTKAKELDPNDETIKEMNETLFNN